MNLGKKYKQLFEGKTRSNDSNLVEVSDDKIDQLVQQNNQFLNICVFNPQEFEKGDTLKINAYKSKEKQQTDSIEALINYQLFDKNYHLSIQKMTELDKLYYP